MRLAVAAAAALLLAACGPKAQPHTNQAPPAPLTCDNGVVEPAAAIDTMVQDLGTLAVGDVAHFDVPAGTAAFFVVSQAIGTCGNATITLYGTPGYPNVVVPTNVRSPSNVLYYDDSAALPTQTIAGVSGYYDLTGLLADPGLDAAVGVFSFPNTSTALGALSSAGSVEAGTWSFTVNDWSYECAHSSPTSCTGGSSAGRYRVQVVTRPGSTAGGTALDLQVYLATGSGSVLPTAAGATGNAQVARWKQSLAHYLGQAGIALGQVTFNDLPAAAKTRYAPNGTVDVASSGPCADLSQLFTNATVPARGVNVFLADDLSAPIIGGAFQVAGVDGSIPGPSGFPGTINSGAIVGLADFGFEAQPGVSCALAAPLSIASCGTDRTAYVTAHEIGHWLGLYHVTEQDGFLFDPLSDTAMCPCHACASASQRASCVDVNPNVSASAQTLITADRCVAGAGCGGGDNLMFWVVSDTLSTGALSPDQAAVMRLNPAVQ